GKTAHFLIPVGPVPFLPNGGMPQHLASTTMKDQLGLSMTFVDAQGEFNSLYSFYSTEVFQHYRKFLTAFSEQLGQWQMSAPCWGTHYSGSYGGEIVSLFDDYSEAF